MTRATIALLVALAPLTLFALALVALVEITARSTDR